MSKIFLAVFLLLYTTSCATQEFRMSEKVSRSTPHYESAQAFFVYGIAQTKEVNTSEICGDNRKVSGVKNFLSPLDVLVNIVQSALILVQVYSPRTTSVTCE